MPELNRNTQRWLLFVVGWMSAAYFHPREPGWNVNTRLALTYAIVDEQRLTIDSFHATPGYETNDKAFFEDHFYADKAIGNALAAVPPYQIARWAANAADLRLSPDARRYICTVFTVAPAFGLLLVVLAGLFERQRAAPGHATALALIGGLGTMLFPYATLLMPYVPACLFAMLSYRLTLPRDPNDSDSAPCPRRAALAGLCMGLAGLFEFLYGLVGLAVWLHVLTSSLSHPTASPRYRILPPIVFPLGALVGLAPYFWYTLHVFGRLAVPYEFEFDPFFREAMASGLAGIHFPPNPNILWLITFHPFRGLFIYSPLLLMAVPGLYALWHLPKGPWRALLCGGLFAAYLIVNAGYRHQWWGGWAPGPRHLIPAIPFLLIAVAAAWARWKWARPVILVLGGVSVGIHLLATGVDPQPPTPVPAPDANTYLAAARLDQWYPNPITIYLSRARAAQVSWCPLAALGVPPVLSWLPLLLLWVAFVALCLRTAPKNSQPPG